MKLRPYPIEYTRSDQQGEGYLQKKFARIRREQQQLKREQRQAPAIPTIPLRKKA